MTLIVAFRNIFFLFGKAPKYHTARKPAYQLRSYMVLTDRQGKINRRTFATFSYESVERTLKVYKQVAKKGKASLSTRQVSTLRAVKYY